MRWPGARTGRGRRRVAVVGLTVLVLVGTGACAPSPDPDIGQVERLLVVSLPGVVWGDVDAATMPRLAAMADEAAIGNLATRVGKRRSDTASAYLTANAGTRAFGDVAEAGVALAPGEQIGGRDTADLLARRLGTVPDGIVYLATGAAAELNDETVYGAEVGMLGDELAEAGVRRAVVANADTIDELVAFGTAPEVAEYHREAVSLLMDATGAVPEGAVTTELLLRDPSRPYGVRSDPERVREATGAAWAGDGKAVVVVEASDLRREAAYRRKSEPSRAAGTRRVALAEADELLGRLVDEAGPDAAVLIVGMPTAPGRPELGVAVLRSPEVDSGLLRSATSGRDGYVQLADLGPTILELVGASAPRSVEGRPFSVATGPHDGPSGLAGDADEASFRDDIVPAATLTFIGANAVLLGLAFRWRRPTITQRRFLERFAFTIVGAAVATFLVGVSWLSPVSAVGYVVAVLGLALVLGALAAAVEQRRPGAGIMTSVAALLVVIAIDVFAGAPLQVNTVFGYSVAVAGRFAGLGNLAFALFSAAAVLLACMLAERGGRNGVRAGFAVLLAALVVDGFPLLGADVGGTLAMVSAFGVTALVLSGRRVGWRELVVLAVTAVGVTFLFAMVDLARPEHSQTHLARFAQLVLDGRWPTLADSLLRRFQASFGGFDFVAWFGVVVAGILTVAYVLLHDRDRLPTVAPTTNWPRPMAAAVAGLAALAMLGWTANDSSLAVPATMLIVVVPVLVDHRVHREVA